MTFALSIVLVLVFLFFIALFAGSETGFVCLDIHDLKRRAQEESAVPERALLRLAKQPERFLALTLIGINMSIVISTSIVTEISQSHGPFWVTASTIAMSLVIFFGCEVLPKIAFSAKPLELSLKFWRLLEFFDRLLSVPILIITSITRSVMNLFGLRSERSKKKISKDELLILLGLGASSGVIRERPHRMARGIIGLKETRICEIMIPRVKMVAVDVSASLDKTRKLFVESGFSRVPVFDGNIDQIIGMIYFKDIFLGEFPLPGPSTSACPPEGGPDKTLPAGSVTLKTTKGFIKPIAFVPEVKNAYELFQEMMKKKFQSAIVLDEFGATAGLVSLEDLIEEVVGEIHDELDEPISGLKLHENGSITLKADLNLSQIESETDIEFMNVDGIMTLNGLILERIGRIPNTGETLVIDGLRLEILQADQKKVALVRILPREKR